MRLLILLMMMIGANAWGQQAPVTRAEFAELFAVIGRGYVAPNARVLPEGFPNDAEPVSRAEVAQAMASLAIGAGKITVAQKDAPAALQSARILPPNAAFFTLPGNYFRPDDLVKALVAFSEGMAGRNLPRSADENLLTTPKIKRDRDQEASHGNR